MLDTLIAEVDLILVLLLSNGKYLAEGMLLELFDVSVMVFAFMQLDVGINLPQGLPQCRVEVVLDVVVGSTWQFTGNMRPLIPQFGLHAEQHLFFLGGPATVVFDARLELVVPPALIAAYRYRHCLPVRLLP